MTDPLWTIDDLASFLRVSPATIYDWRYRGDSPPAVRVGRSLRWRPADVDAWLRARTDR